MSYRSSKTLIGDVLEQPTSSSYYIYIFLWPKLVKQQRLAFKIGTFASLYTKLWPSLTKSISFKMGE
jgi:hypothetical protein